MQFDGGLRGALDGKTVFLTRRCSTIGTMNDSMTAEMAIAAARLVVEEGLEFGPAKRRAAHALSLSGHRRPEWPSNEQVEAEVRIYLDVFRAETQPVELAALRAVALRWMEHLREHRPYISGAVWRGTATRLNDVWIGLFCDDPKVAEMDLLNQHITYDVGTTTGLRGDAVDVLTLSEWSDVLQQRVMVHLVIHDHDDLRGALCSGGRRGDAERGDASALRRRMSAVPVVTALPRE